MLLLCLGCSKKTVENSYVAPGEDVSSQVVSVLRMPFVADSAYVYIHSQVNFGSRVPGTTSHKRCGEWLKKELARHGAQVSEQLGEMTNYAGQQQHVRNIVASVKGNRPQTVLLCAHWDSRPWSDEETNYEDRFTPVLGANDGASGVGVILEIVRQWKILMHDERYVNMLPGLQVVFFDCEDMGTPTHYKGTPRDHTWCLGSQLWASQYRQAIKDGSQPRIAYGVLLDMVGDASATFSRDAYSVRFAPTYVEHIWRTAMSLGYGRYFVSNAQPAYIVDDHCYVNTLAGIPCLDIIDYNAESETGFQDWWHTQSDDMQNINKQTLQAVGETVITSLCSR